MSDNSIKKLIKSFNSFINVNLLIFLDWIDWLMTVNSIKKLIKSFNS